MLMRRLCGEQAILSPVIRARGDHCMHYNAAVDAYQRFETWRGSLWIYATLLTPDIEQSVEKLAQKIRKTLAATARHEQIAV